MKFPDVSRRELLISSLTTTAGLALGSMILPALSSCKRKDTNDPSPDAAAASASPSATSCSTAGLSNDETLRRTNLRYTDETPIPTRTCDNCKLYRIIKPNAACQGCQVVPGPIHPKGWCMSWIARM